MTTSPELGELAAALALARKDFATFGKAKTAKIESTKGRYEYKYGDLADLFDATTPALSANGLTVTQWPDITEDGRFVLVTWLLHKSGQWMRGLYPLTSYDRPQEQGSALTYAKRYAAGAVLGISAEVDDDGAAAQVAKKAMPPDGYADWLKGLVQTAEHGSAAHREAFLKSPEPFRMFRVTHDNAGHESLKKHAATRDPKPGEAA